jgi:formylglycine-generating enzyme required for sulfatase activity
MSGNVWEWCMDWYDSNAYTGYKVGNLTSTSSGSARVLRGGSWGYDGVISFRCSCRDSCDPSLRYGDHGFRCAGTVNRRYKI